ncbi:phosphopantetheine-binding protein, partial [Actinomadura viridis]|uniref:phosphopantetheine-binding protein n=1 Tax=Actinomadura viridis TaxID=58110 RepID=UPI0036993C3F
ELRAHLKQTLPDYMIPTHYITLDRFPLTPTGKLDQKALPAPEPPRAHAEPGAGGTALTGTQRRLADIWAQTLGTPRVDPDDDFFDLGGHSLLATQVMNRIREAFGIRLPLRLLFENPTVSGLADAVEAALLAEIEALTDDEVAAAIGALDSPPSTEDAT